MINETRVSRIPSSCGKHRHIRGKGRRLTDCLRISTCIFRKVVKLTVNKGNQFCDRLGTRN